MTLAVLYERRKKPERRNVTEGHQRNYIETATRADSRPRHTQFQSENLNNVTIRTIVESFIERGATHGRICISRVYTRLRACARHNTLIKHQSSARGS